MAGISFNVVDAKKRVLNGSEWFKNSNGMNSVAVSFVVDAKRVLNTYAVQ